MVPCSDLLPKFPHFSSPSNYKLSFSLFRKQISKTNKQTKPQNLKTQNSNNPQPPKVGETDTHTHKQTNNKNHKKHKIGNHYVQAKDQ